MGKKNKKKGKKNLDVRALLRVGPGFELSKVDADELVAGPDDEDDARDEASELEEETSDLHEKLWAQSRGGGRDSLLIVLQGMDTSGKGGACKQFDRHLDPLGFSITSFGPPTDEEKKHPYLWRYEQHLPERGRVKLFDRSHYESVLVERVRGFASEAEWSTRYDEINAWEKKQVEAGTTILKCMLHISKDEQKTRLGERLKDPTKHWKYNPRDIDERALWEQYMGAYQDALVKCSTEHAPWYVVPANQKWHRDWLLSQLLVETLRAVNPQYPTASFDVSVEKKRVAAC